MKCQKFVATIWQPFYPLSLGCECEGCEAGRQSDPPPPPPPGQGPDKPEDQPKPTEDKRCTTNSYTVNATR